MAKAVCLRGDECRGAVALSVGAAGAMPRPGAGLGRVAYRLHPGDLVFCTGRLLQPDKRGLAFLGRAATAGGVLQTRPRPFEGLRVAQRLREVRIG